MLARKYFINFSFLLQKRLLKTNFSMDKVYLRNEPETEELHISFRYINQELKINREFNFCRKLHEKIEDALARMRGNIEKELNKKSKKGKKKCPAQVQEPIAVPNGEINVEFWNGESNSQLKDITFLEMLPLKNLQLKILDHNFDVLYNQPWVVNLNLPTTILAGFKVYPNKVEMQFSDKKYSKASWYKTKMPAANIQHASWEQCGDGFFYETSNQDVGYILKFVLIPGNSEGCFGPAAEYISKKEVQAGPGPCPFETRHCFTQSRLTDSSQFRVVSYNILADLYADSDYTRTHLFPYCPPYALKIEYRRQLFIRELLGYHADIICLQEVDMKVFEYDLKFVFESSEHGFMGHIAQKGTCGEGIATFYRTDRFDLLETFSLNIGANIKTLPVFNNLWQKIKNNEKLVERICDRSTTLQLSILKAKNGNFLIVANTHLYFHPDADHIRLLQFGFSMLYVEEMYKQTLAKFNIKNENQLAIVFCGDFNSVPECGIYRLMTQKTVDKDFVDWSSNIEEAVRNVSLSQKFTMKSACGTPAYTNYTHAFAACLDYIFYQSDRLEVEQVVPFPTEDELKCHTAIPSVVFPSDHVALIADLKMKSIG